MIEIIKNSLGKGISFPDYMALTENLVENKKTSGEDQSEFLVDLTKLNFQRMKRLVKTLSIPEEVQDFFKKRQEKEIWLVITEAWCADASQIVPVLSKVADINANVSLKLVFRDENEPLMNEFLTNGAKSIPMLIVAEASSLEVKAVWGPRPAKGQQLVEDCKAKNGKFTSECKEDLQKWYNEDKGQSIAFELMKKLQ